MPKGILIQADMFNLKFKHGESYHWFFLLSVALIAVGALLAYAAFGAIKYIIIAFPIYALVMTWLQIRSGVALDIYGKAAFPRGTHRYNLLTALSTLAIVVFLLITYLVLCMK